MTFPAATAVVVTANVADVETTGVKAVKCRLRNESGRLSLRRNRRVGRRGPDLEVTRQDCGCGCGRREGTVGICVIPDRMRTGRAVPWWQGD